MFTHYRSRAFTLKKSNQAEANQLLTVYTKEFGRIEVLARAIRKTSSKLRSGVELFYLSEIEFIQGKAYKTLTDAILVDSFKNIRKDLAKTTIAFKISQLFNNLIKEEEKNDKIWQLLSRVFIKLNCRHQAPHMPYLIYYYLFWNLFALIGYYPELYYCSYCKKKLLPGKFSLSVEQGGIICQNCFKKVKLKQEIDIKTIKLLRLILKGDWPVLNKVKIDIEDINLLKTTSNYYYSKILRDIQ